MVQIAGWLVREDKFWPIGERPCHRHSLLLTCRQLPAGRETSGSAIIDAPPQDSESVVPSFNANAFGFGEASPAGISDGGCDCPSSGFFRVLHIPDFLADVTDFVFDGPTFYPRRLQRS
jgi:hypothetical protein